MANSSYSYGVLSEQSQEGMSWRSKQPHASAKNLPLTGIPDALHATRLLVIEERPFQRVTKSLLGRDSRLKWTPAPPHLPSPPPEGDDADPSPAASPDVAAQQQQQHAQFAQDILLDFAALENSAVRIQLIQASNARERARYHAEKERIGATAAAVRANTVALRAQLADAQRVLALRKGYDDLARRLMPDDAKLAPRDAAAEAIEALEKEIEDLVDESAAYEATWRGRREAFDRLVGEGQAMVRLIKGVKDGPEAKDKGLEDGDGDADEEGGDDDMKAEMSLISTPAVGTPLPEGATPLPDGPEGETPMAESGDDGTGALVRPSNRLLQLGEAGSSSQAASPARQTDGASIDVAMEDNDDEQSTVTPVEGVEVPAQDVVEGMDES